MAESPRSPPSIPWLERVAGKGSDTMMRSSMLVPQLVLALVTIYSFYHHPVVVALLVGLAWVFGLFEAMRPRDNVSELESSLRAVERIAEFATACDADSSIHSSVREVRSMLGEMLLSAHRRLSPRFGLGARHETGAIRRKVLESDAVVKAHSGVRTAEAERIFDAMAATQSNVALLALVRGFHAVLTRVLFPLGIHFDPEALSRVRKAGEKGAVLLLPTHRSHIDYIVLHYVCFTNGMAVPHVVAGENLNMPVIGKILRLCGAFFIRRSFGGDPLYTAVFSEYVKELIRRKYTLECYLEGGRSRGGKVLAPKTGFLNSVVDGVLDDEIETAFVVPVSIAYDRVVESDSLIGELRGEQKKPERLFSSVFNIFRLFRKAARHYSWGRVYLGFAEPIRADEHFFSRLDTTRQPTARVRRMESIRNPPSPGGRMQTLWQALVEESDIQAEAKVRPPNRRALALSLGFRVLYECNRVSTILPTALVGTILSLHAERGLRLADLSAQVEWLQRQVLARGGHLVEHGQRQQLPEVIGQILGVGARRRLVKRHRDLLLTKVFSPEEQLELTTLRNQLVYLFVEEGFLSLAARALSRQRTDSGVAPVFYHQELLDDIRFLTSLLRNEFIFEPRAGPQRLTENVSTAVERGLENKILRRDAVNHGYLFLTESACDSCPIMSPTTPIEWAGEPALGPFLCSMFNPSVESYRNMLQAIGELLPPLAVGAVASDQQLVEQAMVVGECRYFEGKTDCYDCVSREVLQTAVRTFEEESMGVLELIPRTTGDRRVRFRLTETYLKDPQALPGLIAKVERFTTPALGVRR